VPLFSRYWIQERTGLTQREGLREFGPALNIEIAVPDNIAELLNQQNLPIPPSHSHTALIDSGASFTAVDEDVLVGLGLPAIDTMPISTPQGTDTRHVYACKISLPGTPIPPLTPIRVIGCELQTFGHSTLIGRNILSHFLFIYNGVEGSWTLAF